MSKVRAYCGSGDQRPSNKARTFDTLLLGHPVLYWLGLDTITTILSCSSCTHTGMRNNWWKGALEDICAVSKIVIYNRIDCCSDRIDGAEVCFSKSIVPNFL